MMVKKLVVFTCATLLASSMFAGDGKKNWDASLKTDRFIENKGQFAQVGGRPVLYAMDNGSTKIYFAANGVSYSFFKRIPKDREEEEREERERKEKGFKTSEEYMEFEKEERRLKLERDLINLVWLNSNPNVKIVAEEPTPDYYSYSWFENTVEQNATDIRAYKKIIYKELYSNIDVEYTFHKDGGIKYALILHPGADISQVRMKYNGAAEVSIGNDGNAIIKTKVGDIIDHAPVTFYSGNTGSIGSSFLLEDGQVGFNLGNYDASREVIIDPWTVTPTLVNSDGVWECEKDAAGNVYIIGGDMPMKLLKYNSAGALQWTYNTPWDTSNSWLGTFATDLTGISYVTAGSTAAIRKVSTAGAVLASATGGSLDEYWNIAFNCDQTKLVIGGTRLNSLFPTGDGIIFDLNTTTLAVTAMKKVGINRPGFIVNDIEEVRSITSSYNARYYYLTLDTIGAIDQNFSACGTSTTAGIVFAKNDGYAFGYKCEDWRPDGNSGIMAIRANKNFVYTQNGLNVQKRSLVNGNILATAAIPGGLSTTSLGFKQVGNSGIDLDSCGNVYVGSGNAVIKYDANLNLISTTPVSYHVYDVAVSYGGDVIACGATGISTTVNRTGYIQSMNLGACDPNLLACCDANVCQAGPLCVTDPSYTLTPVTPGGVWSGNGVNASGVFNPATAGVGVHGISYTLPCGSDSIYITVNACTAINVCINGSTLQATGGTPTYTWSTQTTYTPCIAGGGFYCGIFTVAGPATTSWTPVATGTSTFTPGSYPVLITDGAGSTYTVASSGSVPNCTSCTTPTISFSGVTPVSCSGGSDGAATASAIPAGTYTYTWQPGTLNGSSQSTLASGVYTVTATDGSSCVGTGTVNITQPSIIDATPTTTSVTCFGGSNGTATLSISGGTPSYTVSWSSGGTGNPKTGLSAGTHTATITDSKGCTKVLNVVINQPTAIVTTSTVTPASCGSNNGSAVVNATGGTGVITYSWSTGASGSTLSGVGGGTYTVTSTDANGCTDIIPVTITSTGGPTATAAQTASVSCFGSSNGTATVSISGGTPNYTVTSSSGNVSGTTINNLPAGTFTATITDASSCITTTTLTINGPTDIVTTSTSTPSSCGASNGSAVANATGGTGVITYSWSTGASGATLSGVSNGTYTVFSTDGNGCTDSIPVTITDAGSPTATAVQTAGISCFGLSNGTATVTISGGTPNYTVTSTNGSVSGTTISNLPGGTFTATVTDANNCVTTTTLTINEPADIVTTSTVSPSTCGSNNGSAIANATGGTGVITYSWSTGASGATLSGVSSGVYSVVATDGNGCTDTIPVTITSTGGPSATAAQTASVTCNGLSNGTASVSISGGTPNYTVTSSGGSVSGTTINNLPAGTYTATVIDSNSCVTTTTVTIDEPPAIVVTFTNNSPSSCSVNTGSVTANATGGTGVMTYSWSTGATGATLSSVGAGTYTVTATDANLCTQTSIVSIGTANTPTLSPVVTASVACNGGSTGSASVTISGGTPSFTVSWSGGASGTSANNLPAGTQTITVTDSAGCVATNTVSISEATAITSTVTSSPSGCINATGTATVSAGGGTPTYTYTWSNAQTGPNATGLAQGIHTVTITDANGCASTNTVSVGVTNPPLAAIDSVENVLCNGQSNGIAYASASGGTPTYTYTWSNSQTGSTATGLPQGTYSVIVTDAGGCSDTASITVIEPAVLTSTVSNIQPENCNLQNGAATAGASGGTPNYSYQWSSGQGTATVTTFPAGTYSVIITDANGCKDTSTVTITNIPGPTLTLSGATNITCNGAANGSATVTPTGGTPTYTYSWSSGGSTGSTASGLSAGVYTATVTDSAGCISTATVAISQPAAIIVTPSSTPVNCNGGNDGTASATVSGGTSPYSILWSNGQTGTSATGLIAGVYTVTVTDTNNCTGSNSVIVTENPAVDTLSITGTMCVNDPTIVLTAPYGPGTPFQWYQNNNPISGATTYTYTGNTANVNDYTVTWFYQGCRYLTSANYILVAQDMGNLPQTNVFTPNGDQINDEFMPFNISSLGNVTIAYQLLDVNIEDYELSIYDRWGVLLFQSTKVTDTWDGKTTNGGSATDGTYYWIAKYKAKCSKNTELQMIKGFVELIR